MTIIEIILLAIALAMDCFTVSIVNGVIMRQRMWKTMLQTAFLFGFFQALMPFLGWVGTSMFQTYIESFDHWIAFALLLFLGGRMIINTFREEEENHSMNPASLQTQLTMAVATSIDALAVGISFACIGYHNIGALMLPLIIIGVVSFIFSIVGNMLGTHFGPSISKKLKPELLGGLVLIFIGVRVLIEHLTS